MLSVFDFRHVNVALPDLDKVMEQDATGSRDKSLDPGCVRFDLLRDRASLTALGDFRAVFGKAPACCDSGTRGNHVLWVT